MNHVSKTAGTLLHRFLNIIDLVGIHIPTEAKINYAPLNDLAVYFKEISR